MLTCSRCRTPIPGDSTFCPMCGRKAPGLETHDTLRTELPSTLTEAAAQAAAAHEARFAVPRPAGAEPSFITPTPEVEVEPMAEAPTRRTLVLEPAAMAAPFHPPHPAHYGPPGQYARPPISGRFRAVGPARIPITPSPARIVVGTILAAVAVWFALWFLPHYQDRLSEEVRLGIGVAAGCVGLAAFALILTGALYRAQAEVRCRRCTRPVIAWKGAFGLHCPLGPHYARVNWILIILTASFWLSVLVVGIGLVVWLA